MATEQTAPGTPPSAPTPAPAAKPNPELDSLKKSLTSFYSGQGGNKAQNAAFAPGVAGGGEGSSQAYSKYDQGLNVTKFDDYEAATQQKRAEMQPVSEKLLNGVTKAGANAVASGLGAVAAPLDWGIAGFSSQYDLSNAPIGSALAKWNDSVAENNPHYYSQAEQDAPAISATNLLSMNFFSDKFLSGVGFLAGAAAGAYVTGGVGEFGASKAALGWTKGLGALAEIAGSETAFGAKLAKLAMSGQNHVAALEEIATAIRTGDKAAARAALDKAVSSIKVQTRAQQLFNTAASTHGEAIMESMGSYNEVKAALEQQTLGKKQAARQQMADSILAMNPAATPQQLEEMLETAGMGRRAVAELTSQEEQDNEAIATSTRQAVYLSNVAVLSLSNATQLKSILSRGYGDLLQEESKGLYKAVLNADGKYVLNAPKWWARAGYAAVTAAPSEMAEEGAQTLFQKTAQTVGSDMLEQIQHRRSDLGHQTNPAAAKLVRDEITNLYGTYKGFKSNLLPTLGKELHDKEFQESVFLGGLIGVLGDGGHKAFAKLTGNSQSARQKELAQTGVDFMNKYGREGSAAQTSRSLIRLLSNEMDAEQAVTSKNPAAYDEARNNQLRSIVLEAKKAGRIDELKQSIQNWQQIAEEEDKAGTTPAGEVAISSQGMKQMLQTIDELDALYDQTRIAYGRAFKGGSSNIDEAFSHIAATRLRGQSLDNLSQRVAVNTQSTSGNDGFDVRGFFDKRDPRASVSYQDISTAAANFAQQRGLLVGDPTIVNLKADLAHAAQLRKATADNNAKLLELQEGTLGSRLAALQAGLQKRPALMPQYREILRERAQAPVAPTAAPVAPPAGAPATSAAPPAAPPAGTPTPAAAAAPASPTPATTPLAQARAQVLASIQQFDEANGTYYSFDPKLAGVTGLNLPQVVAGTPQEAEQEINEYFDQLDADETTRAAEDVLAQARAGQPTGDDANDVDGDSSRVNDITDTGRDADAYYDTISGATADSFGNLTDDTTASGVVGLPVLDSPATILLPLSSAVQDLSGRGLLSPYDIHALNTGDAILVMSNRPPVVTNEGVNTYEFILVNKETPTVRRASFEVPLERLQESPQAQDMLDAHEALLNGELPEAFAAGIPVRTHAIIDIGTAEQNNVQTTASRMAISQQEVLFDPAQAVVVRVSAGQTSATTQVVWGSQSAERQVATEALSAKANLAPGDYLIHSTLRQDGAPAVFPLVQMKLSQNLTQVFATQTANMPSDAALSYVQIAIETNSQVKAKWDGQTMHVEGRQFGFDENAYQAGERNLDKLFTERALVGADPTAAGSPTAGSATGDNAALDALAAATGQLGQSTPADAPVLFTQAINDAVRLQPATTPEQQEAQLKSATVQWNPQNSQAGIRILAPTSAVQAEMAAPLNDPDERDLGAENGGPVTESGATLDELRAEVARILPAGVTVDEVEGYHRSLANNGHPMGLIIGHGMRLLSGKKDSLRTAWHESFHTAMRYVFSEKEKQAMWSYAYQNAPVITDEAIEQAYKDLPFLQYTNQAGVQRYLLEEWLADKFADYMQDETKPQGLLTRFWRKLKSVLQSITSPQVVNLFQALGRGDLRSRDLAPMHSEPGLGTDFRDIALSYIPEARSPQAQESATQVLLAYFINAKYDRLAVKESVAPGKRSTTWFLPSIAQLRADFLANNPSSEITSQAFTDAQLLEAILHRRKQEDTVAIEPGLEGEALQQWLDKNGLYLPDRAAEWRLNNKPAPVGRAYRTLYNSPTAKQSLMGELLKRERGMRVAGLVEDAAAEDSKATEQNERAYDAGMLEGGLHLPPRLQLYLSTIIYREEQEAGGPLVTRSVDPRAVMRRLRTIANIAVLPKSVIGRDRRNEASKYELGSLADFVQKVRDVAAQGQGTKEGAMLSAVAARMAHDFGYAGQVQDNVNQENHERLSNLRLLFNEANQRRIPAVIAQLQSDGSFKVMSAQRRPLWTEVMSGARQIWGALSVRDRRSAAKSAVGLLQETRAKMADWTKQYNDGVNSGQKNAKLVSRTELLAQLTKLRRAFNNLGLVLPEEFYLAAVTGNDTAYEVKVRADRNAPALPLPGIVTTEARDDDGNLVPTKTPQATLFKAPLETSRTRRNDLFDELQTLAETIQQSPEADVFTGDYLPVDSNTTDAEKAQRSVRLATRNMAQQAADYDAAAMENMWLDANGKKQRSYAPGSYLIEAAYQLENGLLTADATAPLQFRRKEYYDEYGDASRSGIQAQQDGVLNALGRFGTWLRSNWLLQNHLSGTASVASLRYFYDGGVYVKQENGQLGQTTTELSERDALLARIGRFQSGLITTGILEAAKLSLLVQHSEHTGEDPWVEWDPKKGALMLSYAGLDKTVQQARSAAVHLKLVLDELYGDEANGVEALRPEERVDNVHGKLPTDGTPIALPVKRLDANGNPTLDRKAEALLDEDGQPVALTRAELEQLLLNTNDYSALPRGMQPLDVPVLIGATVQGEEGDQVPLTLAKLFSATSLADIVEPNNNWRIEQEMLREVVEADLNSQYKSLRKRMAEQGINESHLAPLRGLSGKDLNKSRFSLQTTKERNVVGNRTDYESNEEFLGDFLYKSQLFRDAYGHLTRGHEANFGNATAITKRGKGMSGFGPHAGEGQFTVAVGPTIEEKLDKRTMTPVTADTPSEFTVTADGTDAQGYITRGRLLEYLSKWWNLKGDELALVSRAVDGEDLSEAENTKLYSMLHDVSAGPIKNMFYGLTERAGGMRNPLYIKTSVLPLIPAFTSMKVVQPDGTTRWVARPGLEWYHDLRNRLESQHVDEYYHTTAVKVGGTQLSDGNHSTSLRTQTVNNRDMRRQQVVPAGKQEIISGSQLLALLDGNVSDAAQVVIGGVTTSVAQLRQAYTQLHADARNWQLRRAQGLATTVLDGENLLWKLVRDQQRQMGLDEGTLDFMAQQNGQFIFNPNLPVVESTLLSSMFNFLGKQSLRYKASGGAYTLASSAGMKLYDQLDEAGNVIGVQDPFEERPGNEYDQAGHWDPSKLTHANGAPMYSKEGRALRLHNPTYSQEDKVVTMGKVQGWSFLQGLGVLLGESNDASTRELNDQGLLQAVLREVDLAPSQVSAAALTKKLKGRDLKSISRSQLAALNGVLSKLPAEPVNLGKQIESVDYAECIISGDFLLQHGLTREDLNDVSKLSPEAREDLMKMLGYRIPTQAHQSMIPLRIVGIAPAVMGSVVFAPSGLTYISGADFDIDKLFVKRQAMWKDQAGQMHLYGESGTPQQQDAEYRQAVKGDKFYKAVLGPALMEVKKNLAGVWNRLRSLGTAASPTLPQAVINQIDEAIKLGGLDNLKALRQQARQLRQDIDDDLGSYARVSELAAIERLQDRNQKKKAEVLLTKFAKQLYPDLAEADAVARYKQEAKALTLLIRKNTYPVTTDNGTTYDQAVTADFLIGIVQQQTEMLRTAMEAQASEVEDTETDEATPVSPGMKALHKVVAHYLALNSLNLPMTAYEAAKTNTDTQQALSNRLLKVELGLLTAPALWEQVSMNTDVQDLVDMAADMREFFSMAGGSGKAYNSEGTQLDQRTATYEGRDNIGYTAYMNAALAHVGKRGLRLRGGFRMGSRTLTSFGVEQENDLTYSIERDAAGNMTRIVLGDGRTRPKSQSMTNHMSGDTDNAKHQFAKYLNFNGFTSPHIMVLEGLGYGEKRTGLYMMQPVLRAMADYRARQENSIARALDDNRSFGDRLNDLEVLVRELVLKQAGKADRVNEDGRARYRAALGEVGYQTQAAKKAGAPDLILRNNTEIGQFSDKVLVESLNRRNLGEALIGSLLSSRLPALTKGARADTAEITNLLQAFNIEEPADVKALYAYLVQQRAMFKRFEALDNVVQDLYKVATVSSLVKGDISSENDLAKAERTIFQVNGEGGGKQGLKTIVNANGSDFTFNQDPLFKQLAKTAKFVGQAAASVFLRFDGTVRQLLDPILDTVDIGFGKAQLRETLTADMLTTVAARAAAETGLLTPEMQERGYELITHPTENIVTQRAELLASFPELATNALLRKMEEVLPGKHGAVYWGLKANLVGVAAEDLAELRDAMAGLSLHSSDQVRAFAADLKTYILTADGPTASSQSLAMVLSAEDMLPFSEALGKKRLPDIVYENRQDIRERIFSRPDVRSQVPARPQMMKALGYINGLAERALENETHPEALRNRVQVQQLEAREIAAQRRATVTPHSGDMLELALREGSPEVMAMLDEVLERANEPADTEGRADRLHELENELHLAMNDALGLSGEANGIANVEILHVGDEWPDGWAMLGVRVVLSESQPQDGSEPTATYSLHWNLPAAVRTGDALDETAQASASEAQQPGDSDEGNLRSMRFAVARATPLMVNYSTLDGGFLIENTLAIDTKLPQQPHRPFGEWAGEMMSREKDMAAVGAAMNQTGRAFMEKIGDAEAGVLSAQNDELMLRTLFEGVDPADQARLETAAAVLARVYDQDLGTLSYPAQVVAVNGQLDEQLSIHCEF